MLNATNGASVAIWIISAATIMGVLTRPGKYPEWVYTCGGALAIGVGGLLTLSEFTSALARGLDVYFFLIGMMLLSELAREEKVFDWVASLASRHAKGSPRRLFALVYGLGCAVTILMSNDATAVVLTPAIFQVVRRAGAHPKPFLFACALIANAASFVLPIANPANLVVYAANMPPLFTWMGAFALPSLVSIVVTYLVMRAWFRAELSGSLPAGDRAKRVTLGLPGRIALGGFLVTVVSLLASSALRFDLGLPTLLCGALVFAAVSLAKRAPARGALRHISWGVVPLVGGLFVVVEALRHAKVMELTEEFFLYCSSLPPFLGKQVAAFAVAIAANVGNNLPVGLLAGGAVQHSGISEAVRRAVLIGVDLGPNLSVTGSLATILWLIAIRREGESVNASDFLKLGLLVMPLSLFAAVALLFN